MKQSSECVSVIVLILATLNLGIEGEVGIERVIVHIFEFSIEGGVHTFPDLFYRRGDAHLYTIKKVTFHRGSLFQCI